jgi:hypothetical protein
MSIEEAVVKKLRALPPERQQKVLEFVEALQVQKAPKPAKRAEPDGAARLMSRLDRDDLIRSLISSQALEGVEVPYEEAELILDQVLREPSPAIR